MSEAIDALKKADRNKLALVMSIIPGLGHLFKGYRVAAFVILLAGNALTLFIAVWLALATVGISLIALPAVWFLAIAASAYFIKDKSGQTPPPLAFGQKSDGGNDQSEDV